MTVRKALYKDGFSIFVVSEGYTIHANFVNGMESVKKNAPDAEVVEE